MKFNFNGIMPIVAESYNNIAAHNELKAMMNSVACNYPAFLLEIRQFHAIMQKKSPEIAPSITFFINFALDLQHQRVGAMYINIITKGVIEIIFCS